MDAVFQIFANTLITGSIYGAMAMSFVLAYRTVRFFNLAHGAMAAIGGYAFFWISQEMGQPVVIAFLLAVLAAGLVGWLTDRLIYAPQRRRKASGTVLLVVSLGVVTVLEAVLSMVFGTQFRALTPTESIQSLQFAGASITPVQIIIIAANAATFIGLLLLLYKTKFGRMLRAISDDPEVAHVLGIRTNFYIGWVFAISAGLAGMIGVLVALDTGLQPTMGFYLLLKGVIAAIIGCVASLPGALLGGYLLAGAENTGIWFVDSEWRDAIAFVILLLFLLFRPQGVLGGGKA